MPIRCFQGVLSKSQTPPNLTNSCPFFVFFLMIFYCFKRTESVHMLNGDHFCPCPGPPSASSSEYGAMCSCCRRRSRSSADRGRKRRLGGGGRPAGCEKVSWNFHRNTVGCSAGPEVSVRAGERFSPRAVLNIKKKIPTIQ